MKRRLANPRSPLRDLSCIYRIHLLDPAQPKTFLPIQRFAGNDIQGVISIGQTVNLLDRIQHFRRAVQAASTKNTEGLLFRHIVTKCRSVRDRLGAPSVALSFLKITYTPTPRRLLMQAESDAIDDYCSKFGEPPILNSTIPGKRRRFDRSVGSDLMVKRHAKYPSAGHGWTFANPPNPMTGLSCVYRIHMLRQDDPSRYFQIPRFAAEDPEGVLEIGHTTDLAQRRRTFRAAVSGNKSHSEGRLLHHLLELCKPLTDAHGPRQKILDSLLFTFKKAPKASLVAKESDAIDDYIARYGEPPVLNCQVPGKRRKVRR